MGRKKVSSTFPPIECIIPELLFRSRTKGWRVIDLNGTIHVDRMEYWCWGKASWNKIKRLLLEVYTEVYTNDKSKIEEEMKSRKLFVSLLRDKFGYVSTIIASLENDFMAYPVAILKSYYGIDPDKEDVVPIDVMTILDDELVNRVFVFSFFVSIKELRKRSDVVLTITPGVTRT